MSHERMRVILLLMSVGLVGATHDDTSEVTTTVNLRILGHSPREVSAPITTSDEELPDGNQV